MIKKTFFGVASDNNKTEGIIQSLKVACYVIIAGSVYFHLSVLTNIISNAFWGIYALIYLTNYVLICIIELSIVLNGQITLIFIKHQIFWKIFFFHAKMTGLLFEIPILSHTQVVLFPFSFLNFVATMVILMFLSDNTTFFVIEILPGPLMTCDIVLSMEVARDEPKKPFKIS